jgi:hypothetical protein
MQVGFFFWPFSPELVTRMAEAAEHYGYDMIGIADTPGNAMDPWVAMALAARTVRGPRIALCVGNLTTRHPATTAAAIASIDLIAPGRAVLGIGTGHSSPRNLGIRVSSAGDLERRAALFARSSNGEPGILPRRPGAPALGNPVVCGISGRVRAQGAGYCRPSCQRRLYQFGLRRENIAYSETAVASSARASGRSPGDVELWQIAALDCHRDAEIARNKIGAILAFMAGGYILRSSDLAERGVPEHLQPAIGELRRRYSTRPGPADAALVSELGLLTI